MPQVFISYDRESQPLVITLAEDIKGQGHTVWYDQELSGGQSWWDQILRNVRDCDIFLFALAPRALESIACISEYEYAYTLGKTILPVMITDGVTTTLLPEELTQIHYVDFRNPNDKSTAISIARAFNTLPPSNSLPDPLPEPPEVPLSYMGKLAKRIQAHELISEEQKMLIAELEASLRDQETAEDTIVLIRRLKKRQGLDEITYNKINELIGIPDSTPIKSPSNSEKRRRAVLHSTDFEYDVFISFAQADNPISEEDGAGWIARLHNALEKHMSSHLGRRARIWRNADIKGNDAFDDVTVKVLSKSAVMVCIVSPNYAQSAWCNKEVEEFCKAAEQTGGLVIGNESRIFKAIIEKLGGHGEKQLPRVLQNVLGTSFLEVIDEEVLGGFPGFGTEFKQNFQRKVARLAEEISKLFLD